MKYIRTLKNIEKIMNANPQYVVKEEKYGTTYIDYSDTRYEFGVNMNNYHIWVDVYDRDNHTRQYYEYIMTDEGWQYDQINSKVKYNKELSEKLRADVQAIKEGNYQGKSFQQYDLSKDDTTTLLEIVYTYVDDEFVRGIISALGNNLDNLEAKITYKHTEIDSLYIVNEWKTGETRYSVTYKNGEWEVSENGKIRVIIGIPDIAECVLYNNCPDLYNKTYGQVEADQAVENTDQAQTVETDQADQTVDQAQVSIKKWPTIATDCQPVHKNTIMLAYDRVSSQVLTRDKAPPK